jgi:serine/threonine protein kinase/Flp pilus assembly protein TadD
MAANPQTESLFSAALAIESSEERAKYLDQVCGSDQSLRARVEELLAAYPRVERFLEAPAAPSITMDQARLGEGPGTLIGPYKLVQEIGAGGMGTVWMAQQAEPVKRLVALKVIKPGMDSRQVIARFEAERQALALMDHPNIARVFDAGTTDSSRPYFVMELVKGVPLTKYCDEHRLTPKQRLELFIPICHAIQHAHQKGIIHRDIKPSNVLVALYDGKPVPKVIDFGIAKATGQQLTEHTLVTGFGAVVGTLEYLSPEQAELNQLDIDTRSDIYSLGVLLYELLTGTTPLERKQLKETGLLEVLRIIREDEAPTPSNRLSTTDELPTVAANRGMEPRKLSGVVRGELDWLVMKALDKDRNRRYESASAFAADVQRYLHDEPVLACPPSAWYRSRKFVRRHRTALTMAGMVLFLIAFLGAGIGWVVRDRAAQQVEKANNLNQTLDQADRFLQEGKQAEALAAFDQARMLADQAPSDRAREARLAALKEALDAAARDQAFIARFEDIVLDVQSRVHEAKSRFMGEAAYPAIRNALSQYGIVIGDTPPAQVAAHIQGRPESVRRHLLTALDEYLEYALKEDASAHQWLIAVLEGADSDPWRLRVRKAWIDRDEKLVEQLAREADVEKQPPSYLLSMAKRLPEQMQPTRLEYYRRIQRAHPADLWANHDLAYELGHNNKGAEAVRYFTAALVLRPRNPGIYFNRGSALHMAGEVDAAIADFRQALVFAPRYASVHAALAIALKDSGEWDKALAEANEAIQLDPKLAGAWWSRGTVYVDQHEYQKSLDDCSKAIELNPNWAPAWAARGNANLQLRRYKQALADCTTAIKLDPRNVGAWFNRGCANGGLGRQQDALADCSKAVELNPNDPQAHYNLAYLLSDNGRVDDAIAAYHVAIRLKKDYAEAHVNLAAELAMTKGQFIQALPYIRRGHELGIRNPRWPYPTAEFLEKCERWAKVEEQLSRFLEGNTTPASARDWTDVAEVCTRKRLNRAAARFYEDAFAANLGLADDLAAAHRYSAACVAALAGCGQGNDVAQLDGRERAHLRRQALKWLRADFTAWTKELAKNTHEARAEVQKQMKHWQTDADFAGVRGPEVLAKLPEAERQPWQTLWSDVAEMVTRAQTTKPQKKSDSK